MGFVTAKKKKNL